MLSGVCSAGLSTTQFPAARAGASFHAAISSGKFHGIICPTTPAVHGNDRPPWFRQSRRCFPPERAGSRRSSENDPPPAAGQHSGFRGSVSHCPSSPPPPDIPDAVQYDRRPVAAAWSAVALRFYPTPAPRDGRRRGRSQCLWHPSGKLRNVAAVDRRSIHKEFTAQRLDKSTVNKVAVSRFK